MNIRVRFAPSPTGFLHIGGLRTALFNYIYAKKTGGKIVLRIEDTDQSRKVDGAVENLINTFGKIGIEFDEGPTQGGEYGPYFQSQRLDIYQDHIAKLIESGDAYYCFCPPKRLEFLRNELTEKKLTIKYDRHCLNLSTEEIEKQKNSEPYVIRMKIPDVDEIVFYDGVRDKVSIKCNEIDDQVLIKGDGFPTYHFANVVDDHLMGITHIMRGEEWLPSTPKHVLLFQFFGWKSPKYFHLPLLLNPDKSKLSKRQGDVAVEDYLNNGFLPEALVNYVALLGWHSSSDRELFSMNELVKEFSVKRLQKAGAVFDIEKLKWMNSHYLMNLDIKSIANYSKSWFEKAGFNLTDNSKYLAVVENTRKRVNQIPEMVDHARPFYSELQFNEDNLIVLNESSAQIVFEFILKNLNSKGNWTEEELKSLIRETSEETGVKGKNLFFPLRLALFGSPHGPEIPLIIQTLGIDETIKRIQNQLFFTKP